jgi:hypothetical protein
MERLVNMPNNTTSPRDDSFMDIANDLGKRLIAVEDQLVKYQIGYGLIRLVREGNWAIVYIMYQGREIPIIRELYDNYFDHTITPMGIKDEIKRSQNNELNLQTL